MNIAQRERDRLSRVSSAVLADELEAATHRPHTALRDEIAKRLRAAADREGQRVMDALLDLPLPASSLMLPS